MCSQPLVGTINIQNANVTSALLQINSTKRDDGAVCVSYTFNETTYDKSGLGFHRTVDEEGRIKLSCNLPKPTDQHQVSVDQRMHMAAFFWNNVTEFEMNLGIEKGAKLPRTFMFGGHTRSVLGCKGVYRYELKTGRRLSDTEAEDKQEKDCNTGIDFSESHVLGKLVSDLGDKLQFTEVGQFPGYNQKSDTTNELFNLVFSTNGTYRYQDGHVNGVYGDFARVNLKCPHKEDELHENAVTIDGTFVSAVTNQTLVVPRAGLSMCDFDHQGGNTPGFREGAEVEGITTFYSSQKPDQHTDLNITFADKDGNNMPVCAQPRRRRLP
jgi:hypothetical protein